ncbi:hypothetical protein AB0D10_26975 [Kitasatospora sp. NPDC048545]|uniref:hypothetical protein n=1 Tax=unclassified Kitasatospora TaxID=2633591 RepID=UPI00340DE84B
MKRFITTTVALLGAAALWLAPTVSATAAAAHDGPTASSVLTCPTNALCDDTSWGG